MNKVFLLLDIDGVINVDKVFYEKNDINFRVGWENPIIPKKIAKYLIKLSKDERLKIIWISSWGKHSNLLNQKFNIKTFDVLEIGLKRESNYWKYYYVNKFIRENRLESTKFIIVDDELNNVSFGEDIISITPNPRAGLDIEQLNKVLKNILN